MHRRTVLLGTGVALSVSVAGCADDAGSDDENANGDDDAGNGVDDTETDDENGSDDDVDTDDEEGEDDDSDGETEDEEAGTEMAGLEITEQEFEEDDFWVWVSGIVANNTGEELGSVEVTVTSTSGLEDEEEWTFEVMEDGEDVADYSVAITDAVPAERTPT